MADKTLKLEVITPEQIALQDVSTSVVVPGVDGELGIWPNHAPLLAGLKPGELLIKRHPVPKNWLCPVVLLKSPTM